MIKLVQFERKDIPKLISWIPDPKFLMQWGGPDYKFPLTEEQLLKDIELAEQDCPKLLMYKALNDENETIGHIQLQNIDYKNMSARVSRVLVGEKDLRNKGLGLELIKEILKIAFLDLKLHRVDLGVFDFNLGAIHCYKKAGFQIEGTLRDYRKIEDEYWSLIIMSILENEYRKE